MPAKEHPHGMPDAEVDAVHPRQAAGRRLPRLPVVDPPPRLSPRRPPAPARARIQGGGNHHDPVDMVVRIWTATGWSWTSSTACPASACAPPGYASRWPMSASDTRGGSASTAPTCPRPPTGAGPAEDLPPMRQGLGSRSRTCSAAGGADDEDRAGGVLYALLAGRAEEHRAGPGRGPLQRRSAGDGGRACCSSVPWGERSRGKAFAPRSGSGVKAPRAKKQSPVVLHVSWGFSRHCRSGIAPACRGPDPHPVQVHSAD